MAMMFRNKIGLKNKILKNSKKKKKEDNKCDHLILYNQRYKIYKFQYFDKNFQKYNYNLFFIIFYCIFYEFKLL